MLTPYLSLLFFIGPSLSSFSPSESFFEDAATEILNAINTGDIDTVKICSELSEKHNLGFGGPGMMFTNREFLGMDDHGEGLEDMGIFYMSNVLCQRATKKPEKLNLRAFLNRYTGFHSGKW